MLMCRGLAQIASDYIDGELKTVANLSVRMHLLMCRHCRALVSGLRKSAALVQAHSDLKVNETFLDRVDAGIARALARDPDSGLIDGSP